MSCKQRIAGMSVLLVGMLVLVGCGEKYTPSFSPQVGDKRLVKIRMKMTTNSEVMGQDISVSQGTTHRMLLEVTDVAVDGVVSLNGVFDEIDMELDDMVVSSLSMMTGGKLNAKDLTAMLEKAAGKEFTLQITPDGKLLSTTGLSRLSADIIRDSNLKLGSAKPMLEGMLEQLLGETALTNTVESLFDYASNKPVAVGKSWVKQQEIDQEISVNVENTITLVSHENGKANFNMDIVFTGSGSANNEAIPGMNVNIDMELEGDGTGMAVVDTVTGWPELVEQDSLMTNTISAEGIPGMSEGMEQKIKVSFTAIIEPQ